MADAVYTLRDATPGDARAVVRLWERMARQHQDYDRDVWCWSHDAAVHWEDVFRRQVGKPDMVHLVACDAGGAIVGFTVGCVKDAPAIFTSKRIGEVWDLLVHPDHRGHGLATRLMERTFEALKARGATCVILHVSLQNESAIRLYEKIGMRPVMYRMYRSL